MADSALEELLVSSEVQTARDRLEDYEAAEAAAANNPDGQQELADLRQAMVDMPGAVRMLLVAIDRAGRARASRSTTANRLPPVRRLRTDADHPLRVRAPVTEPVIRVSAAAGIRPGRRAVPVSAAAGA